MIETTFPNARTSTAVKLSDVREDPSAAFYPAERKLEPKGFTLIQTNAMGQKRGRAEGSFVRETASQTVTFYRDIVQNLKAWQAAAPKLRPEPDALEQSEPVQSALTPVWGNESLAPGSAV